jgi:hypothetical protein
MTDRRYRALRRRPLPTLNLLDCGPTEDGAALFGGGIAAHAASLSGGPGADVPAGEVGCVAGTVWWSEHYRDLLEEDDQ